jgi:hypothetical protein
MTTVKLQSISEAELARVVGGVGIGFIGPFAVLKGSNPAENAALSTIASQLGAGLTPLSGIASGGFSAFAQALGSLFHV